MISRLHHMDLRQPWLAKNVKISVLFQISMITKIESTSLEPLHSHSRALLICSQIKVSTNKVSKEDI